MEGAGLGVEMVLRGLRYREEGLERRVRGV